MTNHKKQTQVNNQLNKCKLCGKQFKLNFSYNRHTEKCHTFECEICGDFVNKAQYTEHIKSHESERSGNKTDFIPNLKLRKLNGVWKSNPNSVYKCNQCFEKFYTKNKLVEHKKMHKDNDGCTLNKDRLKYSPAPELKIPRNPFKCQKCNLGFDNKYALDHHFADCTKNPGNMRNKFHGNFTTVKNLFLCNDCGCGFHNQLLLNNHMVLGCKIYSCKYCSRKFSNKDSWLKHVLENKSLKQCVKPNKNKVHNQNMVDSDSRMMKINISTNTTERSDKIDAVYQCESTIPTMPHHLMVNNFNLNIKKEKLDSSNVIEEDCVDQTSATNRNESVPQTVSHNLKINGCSPSVKKEKYLCTNTTEGNSSDKLNVTNYYESTSQSVSNNVTINCFSSIIKKEKAVCRKTDDENNCHQINAAISHGSTLLPVPINSIVNSSSPSLKNNETLCTFTIKKNITDPMNDESNSSIIELNAENCSDSILHQTSLDVPMYDPNLIIKKEKNKCLSKRNVTEMISSNHASNNNASTAQISNCHLAVKQEHINLNCNNSYPFIVRETIHLSIRKTSDSGLISNLLSLLTSQSNFKFTCKICNSSSFTNVHIFALHMSDHPECSIHECIVCEETFSTVLLWTNHMTYHQNQVDKNLSKTQGNVIETESNILSNSNSESVTPQVISTPFRNKKNKSSSKLIMKFKNSRFKNVKNIAKKCKKQYHCDICSKIFYSHLTLTNHQTVHNISRPFACKYCDKTFSTKGPYTNHVKSHISSLNKTHFYNIEGKEHNHVSIESQNNTNVVNNDVDKFPCKYCDKTYLSRGACTKHEKSHNFDISIMSTTENVEECENVRNIETQNSIKIVGNNVGTFSCKYCERTFSSRGSCTNHEKSHTSFINKLPVHEIEDEEQINSGSIESQNTNIVNNYVEKFPCKFCDKTYLSKGACTKHEKSHNSGKSNMIMTENEEIIENTRNIKTINDIKVVHNSVDSISCKYCERTFSSRGPCTNHEKSHTTSLNYLNLYSIEDKEHIKFRPIENVRTTEIEGHEPIITENKIQADNGNHENKVKVGKFVCFICGKSYSKRCYMTNHIILLHKVDPNSPEQVANWKNKMSSINNITSNNTAGKKKLRRRQKIVVNRRYKNRPVSCTICKKHFVHYGALSSHMSSHSNLKPFKCQYCDKQFKMKGSLILHQETHKSEKEVLPNNSKILNKVKIEPIEEQVIENCDKSKFVTKIINNSSGDNSPFNAYDNKQNRLWFACDVCDKKFSTPFQLIIHRKNNCHVEPYVCKICNKSYIVRHRWNRHLKSHYMRNKLSKNSKKNKQTDNLKLNASKLFFKPVQLKNQYKCSYCKKEYNLISYWKKHLALSKECRRHCKRGLPEFLSIQAKEKFLKTESLHFECHICNKTYSTAYNRKVHLLNIHKISEDSSTQCKICGKNYSNKANLNRHYSVIHTKGNKSITCNDCGRTFKHVYSFQEHIRLNTSHHTIPINKCNIMKHSCKICEMEFADSITLKKHEKTHMVTMYECKDCSQLFKSNIILSKHILENHNTKISLNKSKQLENNLVQNTSQSTNDGPTQCNICFKVLKTPKYLSHHMRLHSGNKPFKCDHCKMAFRFKPNLRIHKRRYHSENNMS